MLVQRRNKIRKQMRREDLSRRFALQRKALLDGPIAVFRQISRDINNCDQDEQLQYQLNHRLNQCIQLYDSEENTYLLVGNYLISRPENYVYLQENLLSSPKCLENYLWCLYILANLHCERLKKGVEPREVEPLLMGILTMMNDLVADMEKQFSIKEEYRKVKKMQLHFLCTIITIFQAGFVSDQALKSIKYSLDIVSNIQENDCEHEDLQYFLDFFQILKNNWEIIESNELQIHYTVSLSNIIIRCFKNIPQVRQDCIDLLHFLAQYNNKTCFMTYIFTNELLEEMIYFLQEIPSLKDSILTLFQEILSIINVENLSLILSLQIHMMLTRGMDQAMQQSNNKQLEICLQGLLSLLTKLKYLEEQKLLDRVKRDIESLNFHLMVQGLFNNDQNQSITHLVNIIVDDFYSQEQEAL